MKKILKKSIKYIITYVILIIVFITSLTLVSLIPSENMKTNVEESARILVSQTNALLVRVKLKKLIIPFDNYTDALMVNTAYSIDSKKPFYSFMTAKKNYIPGKNQIEHLEVVGELPTASKYAKGNAVGELQGTVNREVDETFEYSRYWHGYLVILRPLLYITNIGSIRIIMSVIFIMLGIILVCVIARKVNMLSAIAIGLRTDICRI